MIAKLQRYRSVTSRLDAMESRLSDLERSISALREVMQETVFVLCDNSERDQQSIRNLSERMTRDHHAVLDLFDEMRGIDTRDPDPEPPPTAPIVH